MNGGRPARTISAALNRPHAAAASIPALALDARLQWPSTNSPPATTPENAMIAPGARSIPPQMITIAAPTAAMP
jgi:hypothetical protein